MAKEPAISVLMCVFNAADYLAEAVESILAQSFSDFEFIIVNDASSDSSADVSLFSFFHYIICVLVSL